MLKVAATLTSIRFLRLRTAGHRDRRHYGDAPMIETADILADRYGLMREARIFPASNPGAAAPLHKTTPFCAPYPVRNIPCGSLPQDSRKQACGSVAGASVSTGN